MAEIDFTLVHKRAGYWVQFAVSLAMGWLGMIFCKIIHAGSGREYFAAFIGIIFFTLINTVVSIANKSFLRYTVPSYYLYILLVAVLFLSAKFVSGISIWSLEEYRMMFISTTLFYYVASVLVRAVKYIFEAAEKEF
ncbi:MAG: hypothetical protein JWO06_1831 [Bacteroidota bacterium]|nr:hypothetical protein [Bacteroidota bacterium]